MNRKARTKRKGPELLEFDLNWLLGEFFDALGHTHPGVPSTVRIPNDMFRKLLLLCHPDKHANSELSHEVTRWLIEQREKQ